MPAPNKVKWQVLRRWGGASSPWIESGTYLGETTRRLAKWSPIVVTLEPDRTLFQQAKKRFRRWNNVHIVNAPSETGLSQALNLLETHDSANFWLDGHFSSGNTFQGERDTPVLHELSLIGENIRNGRLQSVTVFIDDCRLFAVQHREIPATRARAGYPSLQTLVDWANSNELAWRIEHDIFIAISPSPGESRAAAT